MLRRLLSGLTLRTAFLSVMIVSNAFVWYYLVDDIIVELLQKSFADDIGQLMIWSTYFTALIGAAFVGAHLSSRFESKKRFLSIWMLLGIVLPFVSLLVNPQNIWELILLGVGFSVSLGFGLPCCMEYFTSYNSVETRGRISGFVFLFTGLCVVMLTSIADFDILTQTLIASTWRIIGLLSFGLVKSSTARVSDGRGTSYNSILRDRSVLLYLVPWIMFSLVNYLAAPVLDRVFSDASMAYTLDTLSLVEMGLAGGFAVVGGFLADAVGRKRMAIAGFVALGLGYAILGISPLDLNAWIFHTVADGVAWGMLLVLFVTTLWGDLSHNTPSEKYYAVGVFPFFLSRFLPWVIKNQLVNAIPYSAIFSFTAFFLFIAILPLVYAPETLPEKVMKKRELTLYVAKAQEIAEKYY